MFRIKQAICTGIATLAIASISHAAIRLVPQQFPTIQAGINAAQDGDIVLVDDGVYSGAGNRDLTLMGKAITLQSLNGPETTIIDIQGTPQQWHMGFTIQHGETADTVIQGFTIRNGYSFNGAGMNVFNNSSPTVRHCVFENNYAACWGGAVFYSGSASMHPVFSDCVFDNNESAAEGGAVFGLTGSASFVNSRFTNNAANAGGVFFTWGSNDAPSIVNSTIVGNAADVASALYTNNLKVSNSIIWDNTGAPQAIWTPASHTASVKYSIVQGGLAGDGNIAAAPQFVDDAAGDFHLAPGSPGIDAGDPAMKDVPGVVDPDGDPRVFGAAVDMGADEFRKTGDATGDHAVNVNDLLAVIALWGPCNWSTCDLNGDFAVDVSDLLIVISAWE